MKNGLQKELDGQAGKIDKLMEDPEVKFVLENMKIVPKN